MNRMGAKAAAVLIAGLLVGATACGGGTKKEGSSTGDAVTATTSSASSSSNGDSSSASDLAGAADALGGDCMKAGLAYFALSMQALGASFGASESDLADMQSSLDELKGEIPSEIKSDFTTYADALQQYAEAMKGMSIADMASGSGDAQKAAAILDTPEVKQAQANIDKYFEETCPSSGSSSSSSSS
jgi:hypothetical protein